jgi:hypothetical protein
MINLLLFKVLKFIDGDIFTTVSHVTDHKGIANMTEIEEILYISMRCSINQHIKANQ